MGLRIALLLLLCCATARAQVLRGPTESTTNGLARFSDATGKRLGNSPGVRTDGTNIFSDGYLTLSGETNRVTDDGSQLLFNGAALGGGGDTVWTNEGTSIHLVATNVHPFVVRRDANATNYSQLHVDFDNLYSQQQLQVWQDGQSVSSLGQTIDMSTTGTSDDPWYCRLAGRLNNRNVFVLDGTGIEGYSSDGVSAAYIFDTYYGVTNGNLVAFANDRTNKFSVDYTGQASAAGGFQTGSFTGLTTTNTFYSVSANLLSTVTNVVVVQGGIITGWTVTP